MKLLLKISLLLVTFLSFQSKAQKGLVQIECGAPSYLDADVKIYQIDDYISHEKSLIASAKVKKDSVFNAVFEVDKTKKVIIEINNVSAHLYVAPNTSYDLLFPGIDERQARKLGGNEVEVYFFGLDTTDANYKILTFHRWMDDFTAENANIRVLNKELYRQKLDTMFRYGFEYYSKEKDPYVKAYVTYHFAQIEALSISRKLGDQKLKTFSRYLNKQAIRYDNDQFMTFFNNYFTNFLGDINFKIENRIFLASLKSSPTLMVNALTEDPRMRSRRLAELVILKGLKDNFYTGNYPQSNILYILDSLKGHSKYDEHKLISGNLIKVLTNLEPGYPAPEINLIGKDGKRVNWKTFKGKYVYMNFFETWSETCIKEMNQYPSLRDKYGGDVEFVSICTDPDSTNLTKFLTEHPTFNWKFYHIGDQKDMLKRFKVKSVPSYCLVDQEGFLVAIPALSPSPNGKYETIDKTFYYIKRALHPQETFQVGQKED